MKKVVATLCLVGSTVALAACDTTGTSGNVDTQPPYELERTASHDKSAPAPVAATPTKVAPAEKVFQRAQTK